MLSFVVWRSFDMDTTKLVCSEWRCGWCGSSDDILKSPHPFVDGDELWFCPACKGVDTLRSGCDEPECKSISTCGTPTATGYRVTCSEHQPR